MIKPDDLEPAGQLFEAFVVAVMQDTGWSKQELARFFAACAAGFSRGVGYAWQDFENQARVGWGAAQPAAEEN